MSVQSKMPCSDQTAEDTKEWMKAHAKKGHVAVVRTTQDGIWEYRLVEIQDTNPRIGRVYVESFGAFYYDGRNCFHPKGQTHLIVPTPTVVQAALAGSTWISGTLSSLPRPISEREKELATRLDDGLSND